MCRQNHGVAVDYFALGIMAYEFMMGKVLFLCELLFISRDHIMGDLEKK